MFPWNPSPPHNYNKLTINVWYIHLHKFSKKLKYFHPFLFYTFKKTPEAEMYSMIL